MEKINVFYGLEEKTDVDINNPVFSEIENLNELMTLDDYRDTVKIGGFIDYDGYAYLSNGEKVSDIITWPSDTDDFPEWCTHVIWINR